MQRIFRNSAMCILSWCLCFTHALATSELPVVLDIKQVDGKPAACLPVNNDRAGDVIQIRMVGVSRSTGPASPGVIYWWFEMPAGARPVYLKRGECLLYGQTVEGAIVHTPPKALDVNKAYQISIIPGGDTGPVYGAGFCVMRRPDGGVRIFGGTNDQESCQ